MMRYIILFLLAFLVSTTVYARENVAGKGNTTRKQFRTADDCLPATSTTSLDINNVRTLLQNGGDMWWDLVAQPRYEIPKAVDPANARHSMFAGSLWIGGVDGSGVLRIAAQTYRQSGNDFFPGPLNEDGTVDEDICTRWDRHFKINKAEIDAFRGDPAPNLSNYPNVIAWPATTVIEGKNGLPQTVSLAPFFDKNNDEVYSPADGDYPLLFPDQPNVVPDQMAFWVINDRGNIHTETQGEQIGIEIRMQAFAFSTTNEVNDMTFYKQTVINKSNNILSNTYIGQWVDADLGFYADDYVGCDTIRGLGICYNGDNDDSPLTQGYGRNPPAIGVDFFQGPIADDMDGIDNDKDGLIDEVDSIDSNFDGVLDAIRNIERIGMSKFIYYNNDFTIQGNPEQATHFYGYLSGFWKNGAPVVDDRNGDGNGFPADADGVVSPTNYMFPDYPGNSCSFASPVGDNPWNEAASGINPFDRRFIQSAGPFTLQPGASNEIVVGVVWARDEENVYDTEQFGSVCKLLRADDIAQRLFDVRFDLLDGPDAPVLSIAKFDRELILTWDYTSYPDPTVINNYYENYSEADPVLVGTADPFFDFEGYIVYQMIDDRVSASELGDRSKARVVAQCDLKNNVSTIVNRNALSIPGVNGEIIQDEVMVEGANQGLFRSVQVKRDLFAEGDDNRLVNYRDYYYAVIAYAFNDSTSDGKRYLQGNGRYALVQAAPHLTSFEKGGQVLSSRFGDGLEIKRIQGGGSGGSFLEFTTATSQEILARGKVEEPVYRPNTAPIVVQVINPKATTGQTYRVVVHGRKLESEEITQGVTSSTPDDTLRTFSEWEVFVVEDGRERSIYKSRYTESSRRGFVSNPSPLNGTPKPIFEILPDGTTIDHGIAIGVSDVPNPGNVDPQIPENDVFNNGVVGGSVTYNDPSKAWIDFFTDFDNLDAFNWIRSGTTTERTPIPEDQIARQFYWDRGFDPADSLSRVFKFYDPNEDYEKIIEGSWAPYVMTAYFHTGQDIAGPSIKIAERYFNAVEKTVRPDEANPAIMQTLDKLFNVDVVITKDQNLWSRCVVVETSPDKSLGSGAHIMSAKWRKSRDKNQSNYTPAAPDSPTEEYGLSWFPGYAINMDTGERLNIFFGESTWHKDQNGDDMIFNPGASFGSSFKAMFGRHYVYVTHTPYDECKAIAEKLRVNKDWGVLTGTRSSYPIRFAGLNTDGELDTADVSLAWGEVAWTSIPLGFERYQYKDYSNMPDNTVSVAIRVNRSFEVLKNDSSSVVVPTFEFNTTAQKVRTQDKSVAESALDIIRVVPNPYYGASSTRRGRYEKTQLDTRVKLTNLPQTCDIRIFTLNGALIRTFRKTSDSPSLEWDLKNGEGVPIASGMYVIHVDAGDLGEKVLKFFCVLPRPDLNAY